MPAVQSSPLHLASYSRPFEGILSFTELKDHLFWSESAPDGVPYYHKLQYRPWEKDWKFCLSKNQLKEFKSDCKYYVKVDTRFESGSMKVAEYFKKGKVKDTIVFVSHLDHPAQVNDGLSGVAVQLALARQIAKRDTHYSYLFLVVQEFLGSVAYLSQCKNISDLKMGIFAEMLTTGINIQLQKSFLGDTYIDKIAEMVITDSLEKFDIFPYLKGAGNDEIVFESPGIEVPFISVMRARSDGNMYRQYHTHLDNIDMLDVKQLDESLGILNSIVDVLEEDYYVRRKFEGFTCLSNPDIGLYLDRSEFSSWGKDVDSVVQDRFHSLMFGGFRYFDGKHRISDIASKYRIPFALMAGYIKKMANKGLVELSHKSEGSDDK